MRLIHHWPKHVCMVKLHRYPHPLPYTLSHFHAHSRTHTEPPSITNLGQEDRADDDSVTFVCTVECSIDFHITWLHNGTRLNITGDGKYQTFNSGSNRHKLRVLLTSTSDVGGYTCVINTAFKLNESARSIGFWITGKSSLCQL